MRGRDKAGSRICGLIILAAGERCIANHEGGNIFLALAFSRPLVEQTAR